MNDLKVIEALRLKSERAFDYAYNKYYKLVYYVIFNLIDDRAMANNLANDTFSDMYNNIGSFKGKSLKEWLLIIARGKAEGYLEDNKNSEKDLLLRLCSRILTREEFDILNYHAVFGMSFNEVAKVCNVSEGNARKLYKRATLKLKAEM